LISFALDYLLLSFKDVARNSGHSIVAEGDGTDQRLVARKDTLPPDPRTLFTLGTGEILSAPVLTRLEYERMGEALGLIDREVTKYLGRPLSQVRLRARLDSDPPFIILDGEPVATFDEVATRFVAKLIEADGADVHFATWAKGEPMAEGKVSTRVMRAIPNAISEFIHWPRKKGAPVRLKVEGMG
jgi:hypothetical protein